jgi:predicted transcriptional regulator
MAMRVKKIDIGIKGLKESLKDFSMAWGKIASGKKIKEEKGLYFDSIDTMRAILTNKRLLILKTVREQSPSSVYELAKMLGRDLKNVNQDLKLLAEVGLVTLEKKQTDKKRVIPHVDYSKILLEIPV